MNYDLSKELRSACKKLRTKSLPLADFIPLLQEAADVLDLEQPDAERYQLIRMHPTFMGWDSDFRPDEIDAEVDKFKARVKLKGKP